MLVKKKTPKMYTVFQPNILIGANNDLNVSEARLYNEILNFNHREEPDRLNYSVPYEVITQTSDPLTISSKASQEVLRITQSLQQRTFFLNKELMVKHFDEKHPISINPFPTIRYESGSFEVNLNPYFKGLLLRLDLGFTKGDIELLRLFKHSASHRLYWLIRSVQYRQTGNKLEFEIDMFKESLGVAGQYEGRFDNFKKVILHPIQNEFRDTWVEFEYELIRRGRGGKATHIILTFKSDFELEKVLKLGYSYRWEESLQMHGLLERDIIKIRHNVNLKAEIKPGYYWDSHYVLDCIRIATREKNTKLNLSTNKNKIKNFASYLYKALMEGWWIEEIELTRPKDSEAPNQIDMFNPQEARVLQVKTFPLEELTLLYDEFVNSTKVKISIAEFAKQNGYKIVGDKVEKIQ